MRRIFILLPIAVFLLLILFCQTEEAQQYPNSEEHDWVQNHFFDVLEELLPIEKSNVGYRSYRDLYTEVLEYSFVFNKERKENRNIIMVTVRIADTVSVYDQMMTLHRKNPTETIDSIKSKLKVSTRHFDDKSCAAVKLLYDEFYKFNVPMMSAKDRSEQNRNYVTITLHPMIHTFDAVISDGDLKLTISEDKHPFVVWANKARRSFEKCQPTKLGSS